MLYTTINLVPQGPDVVIDYSCSEFLHTSITTSTSLPKFIHFLCSHFEFVMRVLITIFLLFLFQNQFLCADKNKKRRVIKNAELSECWCPKAKSFDEYRIGNAFCGHEIIKRMPSEVSDKICNPRNVYACVKGMGNYAFEMPCTENETCSPGSPEYYGLKNSDPVPELLTGLNYSNKHSRFCIKNDGKKNTSSRAKMYYVH